MTILNLYQAALIVTIAGVALAAYWAKRQMKTETGNASSAPASAQTANSVPEKLKALNKLFDENLISVDEYVERRRRAIH